MLSYKILLILIVIHGLHAFAFDLSGIGNNLTADGGVSSPFIAIKHNNQPFTLESPPTPCQDSLTLTGLTPVATLTNHQGNATVFLGNHDLVFTLTAHLNGQDHPLNHQTITCQNGQSVILKAHFYRQNHLSTHTPQHTINQSFFVNGKAYHLNATLNFAKSPSTYSCQLISAKEQTIRLDPILLKDLEQQGRIQNGNTATFALDCNASQTTVLAMVYDNLNPTNVGTNILSTKAGANHATGVGIILYKDGIPLRLGKKTTSTPLVFDESYWKITGNSQRNLTLGAGYVKTGEIGVGKVQAQAGLVFFYP